MTPFDCPNCQGAGMSALNQMLGALGGNDAVIDPCPSCGGSGIDPELKRRVTIALQQRFGHSLHPNQAKISKVAVAAVVAYWKEKG